MATSETTATAAETPAESKKITRNRKPSAFKPQIRLTLNVHSATGEQFDAKTLGDAVATVLNAEREGEAQFATRVVARSRKGSKSTVSSTTVYVAPHGFEFSDSKERGVRIPADVWAKLSAMMNAAGIEPSAESIEQFVATLAKSAK